MGEKPKLLEQTMIDDKEDKLMITDILNGQYPFKEDFRLLTLNEDGSIADGAGNSVKNPALANYLFGDMATMFTGEQIAEANEKTGDILIHALKESRWAKPVAAGLLLSGAVIGAVKMKEMFGLPYELPHYSGGDGCQGSCSGVCIPHSEYACIRPDGTGYTPKLTGTCEHPSGYTGYCFDCSE